MMNAARSAALAAIAMTLLSTGCALPDNPSAPPPERQVKYVASNSLFAAAIPSTTPARAPSTIPADNPLADDESDETAWKTITTTLQRDGVRKDAVLLVTVPRDDLYVAIDGMDVPTAAGVESSFSFWHCSCGKTSVIGHFCVADYESNDVIDALRRATWKWSQSARLCCIPGSARSCSASRAKEQPSSWQKRCGKHSGGRGRNGMRQMFQVRRRSEDSLKSQSSPTC